MIQTHHRHGYKDHSYKSDRYFISLPVTYLRFLLISAEFDKRLAGQSLVNKEPVLANSILSLSWKTHL